MEIISVSRVVCLHSAYEKYNIQKKGEKIYLAKNEHKSLFLFEIQTLCDDTPVPFLFPALVDLSKVVRR